jgi:hypothetical protein
MITPAIMVNFRKVWQYSKVQDEYLRRDYTDRVDQASKMLWSFARISDPGNRAVATVASEISVPENPEMLNQAAKRHTFPEKVRFGLIFSSFSSQCT